MGKEFQRRAKAMILRAAVLRNQIHIKVETFSSLHIVVNNFFFSFSVVHNFLCVEREVIIKSDYSKFHVIL